MFVINPDPYLLPCYRISPFQTKDISLNNGLPNSNLIDDYLQKRFQGRKYIYLSNARKAISIALEYYNLQKDDIITIITTSGNFYLSDCVTKEIEKFCNWSRKIENKTKVIFVNHEFGYPFEEIESFKKYKIPLIEDCAHSFFSKDKDDTIGKIGDFTIYSFPKIFPLQIGGLLVSNLDCKLPGSVLLGEAEKRYIKNVLSHYIQRKDEIIEKRLQNYSYISIEFESLGLLERFKLADGIIPGVFMFRKGRHQIDLPELKKYFYAHGIQCSVFYGEESFFIPVHQALNEQDLSYFLEVMKSFIKLTIT